MQNYEARKATDSSTTKQMLKQKDNENHHRKEDCITVP